MVTSDFSACRRGKKQAHATPPPSWKKLPAKPQSWKKP
jgi:hypothetical protein